MTPPTVSVFIQVVWLGSAFGLRILLHRRATHTTGINPVGGRIGSLEWIGGIMFIAALLVGFISPLRNLDRETRWSLLSSFGLASAAAGVIATFIAQGAMGKSWRIGVDKNERTQLATEGLFSVVRNPIFTAMMLTSFGLTLLEPALLSIIAALLLVISIELQVRKVEEPYLIQIHQNAYRTYATRTGRFLPLIGRLATSNTKT
jgi:protein-S-isoprenylcysteine O-methyltransferase Ste14